MSYFVHESSYVDDNVIIGDNTKIWFFCHVQSGAVIGRNCSLGQNVNVSNNVSIGDNCRIQNNVSIYEGVTLEDDVFCGPSCVFTNDLTPRATFPKGHENYKKTIIGKGASIGANATIVCGHKIGRYAFVGAGTVVTRNVLDYELVVGNPAQHAGWMSENGQKLQFDAEGFALCSATGEKYQLVDNKVVKL